MTTTVRGFPFGLDDERIKAEVFAIAEGLKDKTVLPQAVTFQEEQGNEDFRIKTITLKYSIKEADNGQG